MKIETLSEITYPTWNELLEMEVGTILVNYVTKDNINVLIVRSSCSICAYLGVSDGHLLDGMDYDDIRISCHGGLTYCTKGNGDLFPKGYYFFGWDYAHLGDAVFYNSEIKNDSDQKWLLDDVITDVATAVVDFRETIAEMLYDDFCNCQE